MMCYSILIIISNLGYQENIRPYKSQACHKGKKLSANNGQEKNLTETIPA